MFNSGTLKLRNCTIKKNTAYEGGAYYGSGDLEFDKFTFIGENNPEDQCLQGQYRLPTMKCSSCIAGKYQDKSNYGGCKSCPIGKSQDKSQSTSCKGCLVGEYQDSSGSTFCKRCDAGRHGEIKNATKFTDCKVCNEGKWKLFIF